MILGPIAERSLSFIGSHYQGLRRYLLVSCYFSPTFSPYRSLSLDSLANPSVGTALFLVPTVRNTTGKGSPALRFLSDCRLERCGEGEPKAVCQLLIVVV